MLTGAASSEVVLIDQVEGLSSGESAGLNLEDTHVVQVNSSTILDSVFAVSRCMHHGRVWPSRRGSWISSRGSANLAKNSSWSESVSVSGAGNSRWSSRILIYTIQYIKIAAWFDILA